MKQLDRYIFGQLVGPFIFFLLIFGGIIWLNQSLKIIDLVVDNGQSGFVFLQLSSLLLPRIFEITVPIAAFAAAVYLTNRLFVESELTVIMGAGRGPIQIARPYLVFGLAGFVLMSLVTHLLIPASVSLLQDKQLQMRKEFIAKNVVEGEFITPVQGMTFFFGKTTASGELEDVFIYDARVEENTVTHTAHRGQVVIGEGSPSILLFEGVVQQFSAADKSLSTVQFDTLSYDLSQFIKGDLSRKVLPEENSTPVLLADHPELFAKSPELRGIYVNEGHSRIVKDLLVLIVPLLGASVLLSGSFRRTGFLLRIISAIAIMAAINSLTGVTQTKVTEDPGNWPLLYVPPLLAVLIVLFFLWLGTGQWRTMLGRKTGAAT